MDLIYTRPGDETLRDQVERFVAREVEPHALAWEHAGFTPREVLRKIGDAGMLGIMFAPDPTRQRRADGAPLIDKQAVRQKIAMLDEAARRY